MREVPSPREEVVALLADVMLDRDLDAEAEALWQSRRAWSTGAERGRAYAVVLSAMRDRVAAMVARSDQLGAALREADRRGPGVA